MEDHVVEHQGVKEEQGQKNSPAMNRAKTVRGKPKGQRKPRPCRPRGQESEKAPVAFAQSVDKDSSPGVPTLSEQWRESVNLPETTALAIIDQRARFISYVLTERHGGPRALASQHKPRMAKLMDDLHLMWVGILAERMGVRAAVGRKGTPGREALELNYYEQCLSTAEVTLADLLGAWQLLFKTSRLEGAGLTEMPSAQAE